MQEYERHSLLPSTVSVWWHTSKLFDTILIQFVYSFVSNNLYRSHKTLMIVAILHIKDGFIFWQLVTKGTQHKHWMTGSETKKFNCMCPSEEDHDHSFRWGNWVPLIKPTLIRSYKIHSIIAWCGDASTIVLSISTSCFLLAFQIGTEWDKYWVWLKLQTNLSAPTSCIIYGHRLTIQK